MAKGLKTGGRQKGTSNKLSGTVKEMITQFVENEVRQLPGLLSQMEPKEKADLILKLLPYIIPKIAPADTSTEKKPEESWDSIKSLMNRSMPLKIM
jgi:hypothetical protein